MPSPPRATPDQVVAYNLARARELRGWTQPKAAAEVARHLGTEPWSPAVWSAAERSVTSDRVREFTASEIVAFALAFELPIAWFFLEPAPDFADAGQVPAVSVSRDRRKGTVLHSGQLSNLIASIGGPEMRREVTRRLEHLDQSERAERERSLEDAAAVMAVSLVSEALGEPDDVAAELRQLADRLTGLARDAAEARPRVADRRRLGRVVIQVDDRELEVDAEVVDFVDRDRDLEFAAEELFGSDVQTIRFYARTDQESSGVARKAAPKTAKKATRRSK